MINISDSTDITVTGLEVTGYHSSTMGIVPIGIYIHGHDDNVRILHNHVHTLGNYNGTLGSFNINAHGIAAYGDDPHGAIRDLVIHGNTVDHLRTGASESVVVNGNVNHWAITGNHIFDNNNIGIDAIGYETTITGKYRYTNIDRARNGVISANRISHIQSRGNPSYWDHGWCNCADGIYVDGGTHITIRRNHVTHQRHRDRGGRRERSRHRRLRTGSFTITSRGVCSPGSQPAATATTSRTAAG